MIRTVCQKLLRDFFGPGKVEKITTKETPFTDKVEDPTVQEVRHIIDQLDSIPGLWEELCKAASIGKPYCLRRIRTIAAASGSEIMKVQPESDGTGAGWFTIYSEHHAAALRIGLPSEDSLILATIIWALEGTSIKR